MFLILQSIGDYFFKLFLEDSGPCLFITWRLFLIVLLISIATQLVDATTFSRKVDLHLWSLRQNKHKATSFRSTASGHLVPMVALSRRPLVTLCRLMFMLWLFSEQEQPLCFQMVPILCCACKIQFSILLCLASQSRRPGLWLFLNSQYYSLLTLHSFSKGFEII